MAKVFLKGEKVSLGYFENREEYFNLLEKSDLELQQYLGGGGAGKFVPVREVLEEYYIGYIEGLKNRNFYLFAIILNSENKTIRSCSLNINKEKMKEGVDIALLKEYWGKGYGTEALKLLLFLGFVILGLRKIELEVYTFNERAIKFYKKIGFREVGIRRKELYCMGEWRDVLLMEILREEFIEKNREFIEKVKKINKIVI